MERLDNISKGTRQAFLLPPFDLTCSLPCISRTWEYALKVRQLIWWHVDMISPLLAVQ